MRFVTHTAVALVALGLGFSSSAVQAQAISQADVVAACSASDCTAEVVAYADAVAASGGDVDAALAALIVALQDQGVPTARLAAAANAAASRAVAASTRTGLTQVASAAQASSTPGFGQPTTTAAGAAADFQPGATAQGEGINSAISSTSAQTQPAATPPAATPPAATPPAANPPAPTPASPA